MKTFWVIVWITICICCICSQVGSDTLTVAAEPPAVTTPEQAHRIALAYTGFDSTARTDIVLKRFRLATMPMADSAGNEIIKESNLWLVTFHDLDVIKPLVYRDYKVFIDPVSGLLVELYSVPLDTVAPRGDGTTFASEARVADMARFRPAPPPVVPFVKAIAGTHCIEPDASRQVFAISELDRRLQPDSLGPLTVWSIWGMGEIPSFFAGSLAGKIVTMKDEVDATVGIWRSCGSSPAPYEQWK